jgi:hypothetical protein
MRPQAGYLLKSQPPKPYVFPVSLCAAIIAMAAVHTLSYQSAMQDAASHPTVSSAHWQAVLNDFLIGIPAAAATGWAAAYTLTGRGRRHTESEVRPDSEDTES